MCWPVLPAQVSIVCHLVFNYNVLQLRKCPACGAGGSATINEDAFGAFKVVVDANNNRKVAREGSKFLYDDAADSLIRMLWPERVQEYVSADVDRERALLPFLVLNLVAK